MTDYRSETVDETIARLTVYSKRLHQSVCQAKVLYTCFQSLNEKQELRERINSTKASTATNIMMHAVLRELMLILVRVFDKPGYRGIERSDKVSFPVISAWLEREPIRAGLLERARLWLPDGYLANEHEQSAMGAMETLASKLNDLQTEQPCREKLLRDFRDGFLAHELHHEVPRDRPLFGHIGTMLEEVRLLSEATSLCIEGSEIHWDILDEQISESANWLWNRLGESQ